MGYLISETTREEREKIVAEALGNIDATCDGCASGIISMYDDYIEGKKELKEITMAFNARYISGDEVPIKRSCVMWMNIRKIFLIRVFNFIFKK